jgi:hypothetical protein
VGARLGNTTFLCIVGATIVGLLVLMTVDRHRDCSAKGGTLVMERAPGIAWGQRGLRCARPGETRRPILQWQRTPHTSGDRP